MSRYSTRIRPNYRPTRAKSTRVITSLSLVFFAFIAVICLCPVAVKAEESRPVAEYGDVIGIGEFLAFFTHSKCFFFSDTNEQIWVQHTPVLGM